MIKKYLLSGLCVLLVGAGSMAYGEDMDITLKDNTANSGLTVKEPSGEVIARFRGDGNVGIGTSDPAELLSISGSNEDEVRIFGESSVPLLHFRNTTTTADWILKHDNNSFHIQKEIDDGNEIMTLTTGKKVGIGTVEPKSSLHVSGGCSTWQSCNGRGDFTIGNDEFGLSFGINTSPDQPNRFDPSNPIVVGGIATIWPTGGLQKLSIGNSTDGNILTIANGRVGIGTSDPKEALEVIGTIETGVISVLGGSDLAEPFFISDTGYIPDGSVLIIDDNNPGGLKLSVTEYDSRVAGIISGAGGLKPGISLSQKGITDKGRHVALAGRVYVKADATNNPIKPGDMLTSSNIPGHAMKASDRDKAFGSIIGKAMSSLPGGKGLVLTLVSLQ